MFGYATGWRPSIADADETDGEQPQSEQPWKAPPVASALETLVACDNRAGRNLSARLRGDESGLKTFLGQESNNNRSNEEELLEIMQAILRRSRIDGKAVGSIRSWGYFHDPIAEALRSLQAAASVPGRDTGPDARPHNRPSVSN
jgi:hypothetical protein